jgi:hypothetical protein
LSIAIGIEAQWQRVSLGIEGYYDYAWALPGVRESRANRAGAALMACAFRHWSKRYYLRGCALGTFTQMSFELPLRNSPEQSAPMVDLGVRFGFGAWLSSSVGVELRADAAFVLMRPYVYVQHDQVWRISPFTGALRFAFVGVFDIF